MKLWRHLIVLFALLNAATSSANVIYRWETLTTSPTISSSVGEIEIKDDARAAGEGSYEAPPDCRLTNTSCSNADPLSPISRFYFRVNASMPTGADINLNFALGTGARFPLERWFQAAFSVSDALLNLDLFANTGETDMRLVGNTIERFGSDAPYFGYACSASPGCYGATGRWVQAIPEPPAQLLFGVGLLAFIATRRRR
jgi:hypothetical protein